MHCPITASLIARIAAGESRHRNSARRSTSRTRTVRGVRRSSTN